MRRPLGQIRSLKLKMGLVIVVAVVVTVVVMAIGVELGIPTLVLAVPAILLALAMVQFLARGMTSPLRQMATAAADMSRGDYSKRVTTDSLDEVGELARAFNLMATELAETDRIRRDLIANISHDLRTPLSVLRASLENLIDGVTQPDEKAMGSMLAQVERLSVLVAQLLDLSRLQSGAIPFDPSNISLTDVLEGSVRELGPDAERVEVSLGAEDVVATADAQRMHQVVSNLLHNALRHSPDAAKVLLSARPLNGDVVIEVADRGPGIPPGEEERIFERFYRGDSARSTDEGGAGLGLAIARWIVDLHGGTIRAENNEPTGCRMIVTIPRSVR